MNLQLAIVVYQRKSGANLHWQVISALEELRLSVGGRSAVKLQRKLVSRLRKAIRELPTAKLELLDGARGMHLERVHLELLSRARTRVGGRFPFIVEPRWLTAEERAWIVYHPLRPTTWTIVPKDSELSSELPRFLRHAWRDEDDLEMLRSDGKDHLKLISISVEVPTLRDAAKPKDRQKREPRAVLAEIGTNETVRAAEGTLALGSPREPYRRQLAQLLCQRQKRSAILVGRSQVGKSTLLARMVADRLDADEYPIHRDIDRVHQVWRISGKRLLAGMSYLGDWEERCLDLLDECKRRRAILWIEDLHLFGRMGQTRQSDRSLSDFFRGPMARGELTVIGECTPEQHARLEDDAPSLASLLVRLDVHPTAPVETMQLMFREVRELEQRHRRRFHPLVFRAAAELSASLFPWTAFPGAPLDLLRRLADVTDDEEISAAHLLELCARKTGMPRALLDMEEPLDLDALRAAFEARVMGQPEAVQTALELVCRLRAGLTDPARPDAVLLFTGPTGTGKTEMARAIAEYLYGDASRMLRLDMSEYATPDAVARLIGDRYAQEGLLTQRIREQPFSLVLLDEIDKAHRAVLYLLLQLFDEARLTDAAGNTASFHHAVIIMTSNLGARPTRPLGFGASESAMLQDIDRAVREFFPPELFNRIDQVVPFGPLDAGVARAVATKELAKLFARRGLRERNVFVYASDAVKHRVVAEAFDAREGARTVKRYLEDHVGALLADHLSRHSGASMQVMRLYDASGAFKLHVEPLLEVEPEETHAWLEPLIERASAEVANYLPEVDRLLDGVDLEALHERVRRKDEPELLYWLDTYREALRDHRRFVRERMTPTTDHDRLEAALFSHAHLPSWRGRPARVRLFDRREASTRVVASQKDELLEHMAEVSLLVGLVDRFDDPAEHRVALELTRVEQLGPPRFEAASHGLFEQLLLAYAASPDIEHVAFGFANGRIVEARTADEIRAALRGRPTQAVLSLSRLFARALYRGEAGSHIWRSLAAEPEVVRVRVVDGELRADEHLRAQRSSMAAFERALENGAEPLPDNPARLDPTVRTWSFRTPLDGVPFAIEVEDFGMGYVLRAHVKSLRQALEQLWVLRRSSFLRAS